MKNKFLKILIILFLSAILLIGLAIGTYFLLLTPINANQSESMLYTVESGETIKGISSDLQNLGIVRSSHIFYLYGRLNNIALQSGTFTISQSMSIPELAKNFESINFGSIWVSIPEGKTVSQVALLLDEKGVTKANDFISASTNSEILKKYNITSTTIEGYLFPDTYSFIPDMKAEKVIDIMITNFYSKIEDIPELKSVSPEELNYIVTFASIVEKEYRLAEEAPLIASVFENRLADSVGLYSCATLVYVITEIQGKPHPKVVTYDDLQIDSPYNTYKWAGLPPTPISNPGLISIKAAASPADTNYYYFRVVDSSIGKHAFTVDFEDHIEVGGVIETKNY